MMSNSPEAVRPPESHSRVIMPTRTSTRLCAVPSHSDLASVTYREGFRRTLYETGGYFDMTGLPYRIGLSLALCVVFILASHSVMAYPLHPQSTVSTQRPNVQAAMSPDPYPRVIGKGWVPLARVSVTVRFYGLHATRHLRASRTGAFGIGLEGVHWCRNLTVVSTDTVGHRIVLHGSIPPSSCPPPSAGTKLVLHVLTAKQMQARQITVDATKPNLSVTMHVGDVLYVFDPGAGQPSVTLTPDESHFRLIEQGKLPDCLPTASCPFPPGNYWRLVAIAPGDAIVTLSAACRQSKPPCMLPDRALRVTILP